MTEASTTSGSSGHDHEHPSYVKIWAILLVLLVISVVGPMAEIKALTLITAFGIAFVKAFLVARYFMHLNVEPRYVIYLLVTCLAFMVLMFSGLAPDIMAHSGQNWTNVAAQAEVRRATSAAAGTTEPAAPVAPDVAFRNTCSPCHGTGGAGDGAAAAALVPPPANFTTADFWATRDRDHIAGVIRNGGASVGRSASMPAFGAQFDEAAANALADYIVDAFQPEGATPAAAADGGVETDGSVVP